MATKGVVLTFDSRFTRELRKELNLRDLPKSWHELSPGLLLAEGDGGVELWESLQALPPLFLRHMFPLQRTLVLQKDLEDLPRLAEAVTPMLRGIPQATPVAVQCRIIGDACAYRAVDVKGAVDAVLSSLALRPETKHPLWVVSILVASDIAYLGLSTPEENLSRWNGGAVHYGKPSGTLSRAEHKIEEACELLGIDLTAPGRALDLGAAPGGWTSFLLKQGFSVTAVDTGLLDQRLMAHPRLKYLQQNAWHLKLPQDSYDLITCDISRDALRTVEVLVHLAHCLQSGGKLLMTVKFMGRDPLPLINDCLARLSRVYSYVRGRHLWHNREEVTLYLVKGGGRA